MTIELKVTSVGQSLGIVLPEEVLALLNLKEGDVLKLTVEKDASLRLSSAENELNSTLEVFHSLNHRYRNALRKLADE